ncbi:hypothetical protein J6590_029920 [Homalodisca vitripennis]|nr:hypothetical protein J6590_029920 [Homalodisca vitripennis]
MDEGAQPSSVVQHAHAYEIKEIHLDPLYNFWQGTYNWMSITGRNSNSHPSHSGHLVGDGIHKGLIAFHTWRNPAPKVGRIL